MDTEDDKERKISEILKIENHASSSNIPMQKSSQTDWSINGSEVNDITPADASFHPKSRYFRLKEINVNISNSREQRSFTKYLQENRFERGLSTYSSYSNRPIQQVIQENREYNHAEYQTSIPTHQFQRHSESEVIDVRNLRNRCPFRSVPGILTATPHEESFLHDNASNQSYSKESRDQTGIANDALENITKRELETDYIEECEETIIGVCATGSLSSREQPSAPLQKTYKVYVGKPESNDSEESELRFTSEKYEEALPFGSSFLSRLKFWGKRKLP